MFASLFAQADTADRSPWGDFWFTPIGGYSSSGVNVTPEKALQLSAVYACVRELSQGYAVLPLQFKRKTGRKTENVTNHPLIKILTKRPNRWQNAFQWREMMQSHLSLRGNGYNFISANGRGEIIELIPLHPDRMAVKPLSNGDYNWVFTGKNGTTEYAREEIWHIKGLAPDIYKGYSPIELARESLGGALSAQQYGARFFANDAKPSGGWIENPGTFKDKEARAKFREQWQEMQGGKNRGKTAVLEAGMKYHEIGISNADAQFLEARKFSVTDIARLFGVPPHRIADLERSTNNNIEHQALEYVTYTMMPIAERWEASIANDLQFDNDDVLIEHDFSRLLRGDAKARGEFYKGAILTGWMTRNEAREKESMNPLDGLDEPLRPLNMMPENEADEEEQEEEADENETTEKKEAEND